jgi:hypothetical protein
MGLSWAFLMCFAGQCSGWCQGGGDTHSRHSDAGQICHGSELPSNPDGSNRSGRILVEFERIG